MDNSDERRAKIYALHLLNRLGKPFDVREVNNLAAALPLIEADVADWLTGEMVGTASRTLTVAGVRRQAPAAVRAQGRRRRGSVPPQRRRLAS